MKTKKRDLTEGERWDLEKELYEGAIAYYRALRKYRHWRDAWEDNCIEAGAREKDIRSMEHYVEDIAEHDSYDNTESYRPEDKPF